MPTVDPIARAYAIIGVPRGSSTRELKKQYKRLVRQWHPDRWHNDPVSQAEAAVRMRAINDAYETLEALAPGPPPASAPASGTASAKAYRPLTKEELDAIVNAIGNESPVIVTMRILAGIVPMAVGVFMVSSSRGGAPPSTGTLTTAAVLFVFGIAVLVYNKLRS
jgi:hypothetical protein